MAKKMSDLGFKLMVHVGMPIRNLFMPPEKMLAEVEIEPGFHILDFGCGPGAFTILAAEQTGPSGLVHALDIHPLAVHTVENKASKKNLTNIRTILSDGPVPLDDKSLDLVIFFDVFHTLDNPDGVLKELHRVLKPEGVLCFSDHHMKEGDILSRLDDKGLFKLQRKGKMTFTFSKV